MQLDSSLQAKVEPALPPPDKAVHFKEDAALSAYAAAAADAYAPHERAQSAVLKPGDQKSGLITRVQDGVPTVLKDDINNVLKDGPADSQKGKWTDKTKDEWRKLVDDLKGSGMDPDNISSFLNELGAGINTVNRVDGSKNVVGMMVKPLGAGKFDVFMSINGPNIDRIQNDLDGAFGHESNTVLKAGTLGGPPEQHI